MKLLFMRFSENERLCENFRFPPLFLRNTPGRRNAAACKWRLIPSIKVNEVGAQLTQSVLGCVATLRLALISTLAILCFLFCFLSLFVALCASFTSWVPQQRERKKSFALLPHVLINFDVNSSPQDPYKLINSNLKKKKKSFTRTKFPLCEQSVSQVQGKGQVLFFTPPPNPHPPNIL